MQCFQYNNKIVIVLLYFFNICHADARVERITNILTPEKQIKNSKYRSNRRKYKKRINSCNVTLDVEGDFAPEESINLNILYQDKDNIARYLKEINSDLFTIEKNGNALHIRILKACNKISIPMLFKVKNDRVYDKEFYIYNNNSKNKQINVRNRRYNKKNNNSGSGDLCLINTSSMYHIEEDIKLMSNNDRPKIQYQYVTIDSKNSTKTPFVFKDLDLVDSNILWGDVNVRDTGYAKFFYPKSFKKKLKKINKYIKAGIQAQTNIFGNYYSEPINVLCFDRQPYNTDTAGYMTPTKNSILLYCVQNYSNPQIARIIFHELSHRLFNDIALLGKSDSDADDDNLMIEGLAEYYSFKGLSKVISKKSITRMVNTISKDYHRNRSNNYKTNNEYNRFLYDKGFMFCYHLDQQIKAWSNNNVTLTDIMNRLIRTNSESFNEAVKHCLETKNTLQKPNIVHKITDTICNVFNNKNIAIDKNSISNVFNEHFHGTKKVPHKKINIKHLL